MKQLKEFAAKANETKGAAFTLTRTKAKMWTIYFPQLWDKESKKGIKFASKLLPTAIAAASKYLDENRKMINEQILRYEI